MRQRRLPGLHPPTALAVWLFGALLGAPAPGQPDDPGESPLAEITRAVADAERGLEEGEPQLAESRYRTALFEGWLLLGNLAREQSDLPEARRALERAVASAAVARRARLPLAAVLAEMGLPDEAEAILRLLIAEDKDDFEARRLLAKTLAEADRLDESVQEVEQLVYLTRGNPEDVYLLATAYLKQERVEEADAALGKIAELIPGPQTHLLIGRTYRDSEQYERARRALEKALELDPKMPRAHWYLGTVDLREEDRDLLDSALAHFEQELLVNPDDPLSSLYLGIGLTEQRRFAEAIPHLELASGLEAMRADAFRFLGQSLAGVGSYEEAVAAFRRALEAAERDVGERPREELEEATARQLSSIHFQLGQALRRTGDRTAADFHFAAAKEYQSLSTESARETLGRYLTGESVKLGELEASAEKAAAEPAFGEGQLAAARRSLESTLARTYLNLGVIKTRAGQPRRAADLFAQAVELDPEAPGLRYSLGVARFNAEQYELATDPLARALEERPGDVNLQQMLALSWLNSDEPGRAAELLGGLPGRDSDPRLQYAYGLALVRGGRAGEAEEVFRLLLRDNAAWPELNVVLAQAHAQQGDFDAAVELLWRAIELDSEVAEAHATLGEIHMRKGELDTAEEHLRAELRAHPRDTRTMYTLATVLDMAQKTEDAKELLRSLLDAQPHLAKGRYLLGKILLAQGSTEQARGQLEAAAGLAPEDPNVHYQLGQAYQKLGLREEARREFDTFRELKNERRKGEDG